MKTDYEKKYDDLAKEFLAPITEDASLEFSRGISGLLNRDESAVEKKSSSNEEHLNDREKIYTEFLEICNKLFMKRGHQKEKHKWIYFWFVIVFSTLLVIASLVISFVLLASADRIHYIPILITSLVSLLGVVIGVPMLITKYLFDPEEDAKIVTSALEIHKSDIENRKLIADRESLKTEL
jgi:hypothetical protein